MLPFNFGPTRCWLLKFHDLRPRALKAGRGITYARALWPAAGRPAGKTRPARHRRRLSECCTMLMSAPNLVSSIQSVSLRAATASKQQRLSAGQCLAPFRAAAEKKVGSSPVKQLLAAHSKTERVSPSLIVCRAATTATQATLPSEQRASRAC